ncbi:MAG: alpha-ketoglutarate-dependent dioxygenase AlkB [Algicola sp.]|nr:alpha-ketoglutarate-dependent dioxygenase AlkB [Algicola sp.]
MTLFDFDTDHTKNWLPKDGMVNYYGKILPLEHANAYFDDLLKTIAWQQDEVVIYGKRIRTKRKVAWYGDQAFKYTYANTTKKALPWPQTLNALKALTEQHTKATYNACLLNLYHTGNEGMSWHCDAEPDLKKEAPIASLSFGAQRKFSFKHKQTKERVDIFLEHGSLLLMTGSTQTHWLHSLPPTKKVTSPRINLTFRTITT